MPWDLEKQSECMQQQSLGKAAEQAAAEVIHDAQDYVAAESAAMRNKQAKDKSVDQLTVQGELCSIVVILPCKALGSPVPAFHLGSWNLGAQCCVWPLALVCDSPFQA